MIFKTIVTSIGQAPATSIVCALCEEELAQNIVVRTSRKIEGDWMPIPFDLTVKALAKKCQKIENAYECEIAVKFQGA